MTYGQELREQWRSWVGPALGLSVGVNSQVYTLGLFAPHLIEEFSWSRSVYALQGTLSLGMFLLIPIIGRLTDLIGSRKMATCGVVVLPICYVAFSAQTGDLALFFLLSILKMIIGATTISLVYCRLVALNFSAERGLALAICASAPALLMAIFVPLLGSIIESHGWRSAYLALAALSLVVGGLGVLIIPSREHPNDALASIGSPVSETIKRDSRNDYCTIIRDRAFWIIFGCMFFCNVPAVVAASQFGLVLIEQGIEVTTVPWVISLYAVSVVVGRIVCGLALDKFPAYKVGALSLSLPAIGLLVLGGNLGFFGLVLGAVVLIGVAQGAEGDVAAYMVAEYFPGKLYGSVSGLIGAGIALSSATGAILLSVLLQFTNSSSAFLTTMGLSTLCGAWLLTLLGSRGKWRVNGTTVAIEQVSRTVG